MKNQKGMTLLEILVAIGLYTIIILMFGQLINIFSNLKKLTIESSSPQQNTDFLFQYMLTDLRSMAPSSVGSYPIESASSSSLTFYSDSNQDGLMERIRYLLATSTLERGSIAPSGNPLVYATSSEIIITIAPNILVNQSYFEYFDKNYTGAQTSLTFPIDLLKIRAIRASFTVDNSTTTTPLPINFSAFITPRNLKSD